MPFTRPIRTGACLESGLLAALSPVPLRLPVTRDEARRAHRVHPRLHPPVQRCSLYSRAGPRPAHRPTMGPARPCSSTSSSPGTAGESEPRVACRGQGGFMHMQRSSAARGLVLFLTLLGSAQLACVGGHIPPSMFQFENIVPYTPPDGGGWKAAQVLILLHRISSRLPSIRHLRHRGGRSGKAWKHVGDECRRTSGGRRGCGQGRAHRPATARADRPGL